MILKDIYAYLKQSAILRVALEAGENDSKLYPNYARMSSKVPYIVYRSTNPGGTTDEVLNTEQITLTVTSESFLQTVEISFILTELLDLTENKISSSLYNIYYAKKVGGSDYVDELGRHVRALNFLFKFKKQ